MSEHPVAQIITGLDVETGAGLVAYEVGVWGVTRIEATTKSGLHADIPYLRVWKGDLAVAEFCQHGVVGVYFGDAVAAGEIA